MTSGQHLRADGNLAKWKILKYIGVISDNRGYRKEIRQLSFEGGSPNYDIRTWRVDNKGHEYPCKGATLSYDELRELYKILKKMFG